MTVLPSGGGAVSSASLMASSSNTGSAARLTRLWLLPSSSSSSRRPPRLELCRSSTAKAVSTSSADIRLRSSQHGGEAVDGGHRAEEFVGGGGQNRLGILQQRVSPLAGSPTLFSSLILDPGAPGEVHGTISPIHDVRRRHVMVVGQGHPDAETERLVGGITLA